MQRTFKNNSRNSAQKKKFDPRRARFIALGLILVALLLGVFDSPAYASKVLRAMHLKPLASGVDKLIQKFPYRMGLDIQGGTHLVYKADMSAVQKSDQAQSLSALRDVIERRVNLFGVAEPSVYPEQAGGEEHLVVELAGVHDIHQAIDLIGQTPFLEFRELSPSPAQSSTTPVDLKNADFVSTLLTGRHIQKADLNFDKTTGDPIISLQLTGEGTTIFSELTKRNINKPLAIFLDGSIISAPTVREQITGGQAQISGRFTLDEAKSLVGRLNAGALPVPITLLAQQNVGASLGQESLAKSLKAGLIGFIFVGVFMLLWYRLPGALAILALLLYVSIILALFKLIPVTLTIAGITGFILSIGIAVDANVLIFERMKEEINAGKSVEEGVQEGFTRAWSSIRDSNISGLITAAILYWLGSSVVKGFALTLGIGILISLLSAVWVTRTILLAILVGRLKKARWLFLSGFSK